MLEIQKASGQSAVVFTVRKQGQCGVCDRYRGKRWASDCRFQDAESLACGKKAILHESVEAALWRPSTSQQGKRSPVHSGQVHMRCVRI